MNDFYPLTIFEKHSMFDVLQSSEYASGLLKLFYCGSKADTGKSLWQNYLKCSLETQNFLRILMV